MTLTAYWVESSACRPSEAQLLLWGRTSHASTTATRHSHVSDLSPSLQMNCQLKPAASQLWVDTTLNTYDKAQTVRRFAREQLYIAGDCSVVREFCVL